MICPHCKQEIDGYIAFHAPHHAHLNLNLAAGAAQGIGSYMVNNVCAAQPISFPQTFMLNLNANGCAGGQPFTIAYLP